MESYGQKFTQTQVCKAPVHDFYDMTEQCCSLRSSVTGRGGIGRFPSGGINFTGGRSTYCKRPPDRVAYHSEADHQTESSVMHMG